jgi:hypothetical protein
LEQKQRSWIKMWKKLRIRKCLRKDNIDVLVTLKSVEEGAYIQGI